MPIYEYRCEKCGVFEETQRITDPALDKCPTCRRKVRRLISNTSFQLKGGGWYVTDYARSGKGGGKSGDKSGDKSGETSGDKGSDKASSKDGSSASESASSTSDKGSTSKSSDTKGASSSA
jgi:putative FmdB family regulatory protein